MPITFNQMVNKALVHILKGGTVAWKMAGYATYAS